MNTASAPSNTAVIKYWKPEKDLLIYSFIIVAHTDYIKLNVVIVIIVLCECEQTLFSASFDRIPHLF